MIAIIIGKGRNTELYGLDEHLPLPLFPLVDRPLLHHIIEYLVALGVRRFEFILNHLPEKVESQLGDGARWGCSFCFHLYPSGSSPYKLAETIASGVDDQVLLGRADKLPELQLPAGFSPALFVNTEGQWTGWAVFPAHATCFSRLDQDHSAECLSDFEQIAVEHCISFATGSEFLEGQRQLLEGRFSGLMIGGRQTEPGIWISRNVSLHPTVRLEAPVYIGPNCKIGRGARIGPFAVVGGNCIVDDYSSISHSSVAPGTYIGEALELDQLIVDRNRLVNVKIGTSFLVSETFLLGSLTEQASHRPVQQLISRLAAALLFLAFLPAASLYFLFLLVTKSGEFVSTRAIQIPADDNPAGWRDYGLPHFRTGKNLGSWGLFFCKIWPGLLAVFRGHLFVVGVRPRSRLEIERLPNDWKAIYLKSKGGLITEASVMFGEAATDDELYTAEAYYGATEGFQHDLKLLGLCLWRLIARPKESGITGPDPANLAPDHNS